MLSQNYQVIDTIAPPQAQTEKGTATIKTRTIEVQVVKIDNRQMTQSVFRQLPERSPFFLYCGNEGMALSERDSISIDYDCSPIEIDSPFHLWGIVNYSFDSYKCDFSSYEYKKFHLLFVDEDDGILYRKFFDFYSLTDLVEDYHITAGHALEIAQCCLSKDFHMRFDDESKFISSFYRKYSDLANKLKHEILSLPQLFIAT